MTTALVIVALIALAAAWLVRCAIRDHRRRPDESYLMRNE